MSKRKIVISLWFGVLLLGITGAWLPAAQSAPQGCSSLFFSEYVEGSSYNKGVEIFNGLGRDEDLSIYEIRVYRNGGADYDRVIPLTGALAGGEVFVVAHSSAAFDADLKTGKLDFNGDDGVALVKDGVILDFIGDVLGDPGSQWGSGNVSTKDHTLRRKRGVAAGDANPNDPFDPTAEWDGFPKDAFDGLGWHDADCAAAASTDTPTPVSTPTPAATATPTPAFTPTPSSTPTATSEPTPIPQRIFINEYMPAPPSGQKEYIELYNANDVSADVSGWQLDDVEGGSRPYTLPAGSLIPARGLLLVRRNFGLNNSGDAVRLLAPDGSLRDSHIYDHARKGGAWSRMGDGASIWTEKYPPSPGQPNVAAQLDFSGHLYQGHPPDRSQVLVDHNIGLWGYDETPWDAHWLINGYVRGDGGWHIFFDTAQALYLHYYLRPAPRDGMQWSGVSSPWGALMPPDRIRFDVPASGVYPDNDFWMARLPPTPTPLPPDFVRINEFMPSPKTIDFDGDGEANYLDEYIELYNPADAPVDLSGWQLDDSEGGSQPYRLPQGSVIPAHSFLLFFRKDTGIALNNGGDSVRLLAPDGVILADQATYDHSSGDTPWSRTVDGGGEWTESYPPSPGGPNMPPTATPSPAVTLTPTVTLTPSPVVSSTPTPSPTPTITPTPHTSPTTTPVAPGFLTLNEILPAPKKVDFNGDGEANLLDEYIELYNPNGFPIGLDGWALDDDEGGSRSWPLPDGTIIDAHGFLLFFRDETGIALNNDGDRVRLLAPNGQIIDSFGYENAVWDQPWSRTVDGAGEWTLTYPPSPGGPNLPPPPTPTPWPTPAPGQIALNEILPAPRNVDWDGDGTANFLDEWIELYNSGTQVAHLGGWRLWRGPLSDDGLPTGEFAQLSEGAFIQPGGYFLIFRSQSRLALPNHEGSLYLVQPLGEGWRIADAFTWQRFPGYDRSFSRLPDGFGPWDVRAVTPGQSNAPLPTPPAPPPAPPVRPTPAPAFGPPQSIANAYRAPAKTIMTLRGAVTVAPGAFSKRILYLQDDSAGILVYLRRGKYPPLQPGDRVQVQGRLKDFHGQREMVLSNPYRLTLLGSGPPPEPQFVRTGQVNDGMMGRLLLVAGHVQNVRKYSFDLDDGSGPVRIEHPYRAPWPWPKVQPDMTLSVTGVVARYKNVLHILPRSPQEISPPPGVLPTTGGRLH